MVFSSSKDPRSGTRTCKSLVVRAMVKVKHWDQPKPAGYCCYSCNEGHVGDQPNGSLKEVKLLRACCHLAMKLLACMASSLFINLTF